MTTRPAAAPPPKRGDIHWVDFNPARGSEQAGKRPAVIVSVDSFNRVMPVVTVAAITTTDKKSKICLELPQGRPTPERSFVMPFQVMTLAKERLDGFIGSLTAQQLLELERLMRLCWGL